MKKIYPFILLAIFALSFTHISKKTKHILIFCKTAGYHHASIPAGIAAIQKLGAANNFEVDTTTNASLFTTDNLKKYDAVIFLSTTGDVLNEEQQKAFEGFIHSGKGFMGIHSATDTEYGWDWYNRLVGAYFLRHPKPQEAMLHVVDKKFIATKNLPSEWKHFDEWYNFKSMKLDSSHIVMTVDEKSYTGGENGDLHPVTWYRDFEGGRTFYTALGHTDECYLDPLYLSILAGGISYVAGK